MHATDLSSHQFLSYVNAFLNQSIFLNPFHQTEMMNRFGKDQIDLWRKKKHQPFLVEFIIVFLNFILYQNTIVNLL